jgi:hypothetical protein
MFLCENCGVLTESGQPSNKVVTLYRDVEYVHTVSSRKQEKKYGLSRGDTWTTYGKEIEKEIDVCPECFSNITGQAPKRKVEQKPKRRQRRRNAFTRR